MTKTEKYFRKRFLATQSPETRIFGGLLLLIGPSVVDQTGNIYAGLYYPMIVAGITFVVGAIFPLETHGHKIWYEPGPGA